MGRTRPIRNRRMNREAIAGYVFASPWILGFIIFTGIPIILSFYYSFCDYTVLNPPSWVGLGNYKAMLDDELFWVSLYNTLYYAFYSIPLNLIWGLILALLINQELRGISWFRACYYLPSIIGGVPIAMLWRWVFNPRWGLINTFLDVLGIEGPLWLLSEEWVKPAFIIMNLWGVGSTMMIYLAGLKGIPSHLYDAAEIDGANAFGRFWYVTIPMLSPTIFFNIIMGIIGAFQIFSNAYIMTEGGPANASLFYVLYLYRNAFEYFRMGYASAMAWILFIIVLVLTVVQFRLSGRWVYYEGFVGR
ncbi:MAG: sugar ABC transporter permease [Firmicutes bacterium]|nr:sugar ABC transporter permease [Bacillota bacterium]